MTVIVYRNGIMASDSCIAEDGTDVGDMRKIVRSPSGCLAGACGLASSVAIFVHWASKDFPVRTKPVMTDEEFIGMIVKSDGSIWFYEQDMKAYELSAPFYALGTGGDIALGAMGAGASAIKAVRIAIRYRHGCRGPIVASRLDGEPIGMRQYGGETVVSV